MENFYERPGRVERLRAEPVGEHLDPFLGYMAAAGFSWLTLHVYLGGPVHFGRWAKRVGLRLAAIKDSDVERFRQHLRRCRCRGYHGHRCDRSDTPMLGLKWFVRYLRHMGLVSPAPEVVVPPILAEFEAWMRGHRGTAERTLIDYRRHLLHFVGVAKLRRRARIDAPMIRAYVITRARETTPCQMLTIVRALRMFVRFLVATDQCPAHLDRAVPSVPNWRLATLPRYLAAADVDRVLAACVPATPVGMRDRAILLLLARLGLRAGDVRDLQMTDIDWSAGRIRVVGKLRRPAWLPLPQDVGDAVLTYLTEGRPQCSVGAVFLCSTAPHRPLGATGVGGIAHRAIDRAGVVCSTKGAHVFRHSAATALVRGGATLDDIGVLLRHSSRESTAVYAKVDRPRLLTIAQPWPEASP